VADIIECTDHGAERLETLLTGEDRETPTAAHFADEEIFAIGGEDCASEAATAVFIVTAPEVDPLSTIDALVPPAEPIVNKSEVGAVPIPRAVVILALPVTSNTYEGAFVPIPTLPVAVILIRSVSVVSKCI
jgi:hypothetical protein